jgi:hypothetical protein
MEGPITSHFEARSSGSVRKEGQGRSTVGVRGCTEDGRRVHDVEAFSRLSHPEESHIPPGSVLYEALVHCQGPGRVDFRQERIDVKHVSFGVDDV